MGTFIDLTGWQVGYWTVLRKIEHNTHKQVQWLCRCVCGKERAVISLSLHAGKSKSCGCMTRVTHGMHKSPEYGIWRSMKNRCHIKKHKGYRNYGARGIKVCERWLNSFENFYADMGPRPSPEHSIDRKNNNGNYEPGNCRWATNDVQHRNRSDTHFIEFAGERLPLLDWATKLGLSPRGLRTRLERLSLEQALTMRRHATCRGKPTQMLTALNRTQSLNKWAVEFGISRDTIRRRLAAGLSIEEALTVGRLRRPR